MNVVKYGLLSGLIAVTLIVAPTAVFAFEAAPATSAVESPVLEKPVTLSPDSMQLADQLGIASRIQRVEDWSKAPGAHALELVQNKQAIMQAALVAMLQVRAASSQISYDIFEAGQLRTLLEGKRDRTMRLNSIANFVSGGISELSGGAFQLVPNIKMENAGNIVEMVGGAAQTALSTVALRQQQGQTRTSKSRPNMLAPIFDQNTNQESRYPAIVWKYLNSPPAAGGDSRRITLIKQWLEYGRLEGREAPRIAALTGGGGPTYRVTIDVLEDRQAMLSDVNALVSRIDRQLLELLLYSDLQTGI